ncbi:MAG: hypothetical protein ACRES8_07850 [Nevskiaceae bacterium]
MKPGISLHAYRPRQFPDLVRVGRDHDGGYVLPRSVIERSSALLSLGVADDWSFEAGALEINPGLRITCVDGTTSLGRIVKKTVQKAVDMIGLLLALRIRRLRRNASYVFSKIGDFRSFFSRHLLLPMMVGAEAGEGRTTLPALIERTHRQGEWLLIKCDIEGSEYEVLPTAVDRLDCASALLVEFHRLHLNWDRYVACMDSLSRNFLVAHVHGNNFDGVIPGTAVPATLEITLVNRALVEGTPPQNPASYPLAGLDMACTPKREDLALSFD